jgi:uncharacterized protein YgbK (DUF1537 family)
MPRFRILPEQKLNLAWRASAEAKTTLKGWETACRENEICMLDTNDLPGSGATAQYAVAHGLSLEKVRVLIADSMGCLVKWFLDRGLDSTLMITGGDTLLGVMKRIGIDQLTPVGELAPGTVLSLFHYQGKSYPVISKSGGFGTKTLILDLMNRIRKAGKGRT